MRFCVVNLGCKVNRVESDAFEAVLLGKGFSRASEEESDVIVVNTCTVTGEAEKKTRKAVRRALRSNDHARVVVTGCAAAIDPEAFASMNERVDVVAKGDVESYLACLADASTSKNGCAAKPVGSDREPRKSGSLRIGGVHPDALVDHGSSVERTMVDEGVDASLFSSRTRVGLKVQDGCDNACTYCIVHVARGRATSVAVQSVVERVDASLFSSRTRVGLKVQDGCDNACTYCIVHVARGRATSVAVQSVVERAVDLARSSRTRVGLKVQDGCDNACTYCIVHVARGRATSVAVQSVVERAVDLARSGAREIVLSGINIGSYDSGGVRLAGLLDRLLSATQDIHVAGEPPVRFRVSSIEPADIDDGFVELLASARLAGLLDRLLSATQDIHVAGEPPVRFRVSSIEPADIDDGFVELLASADGRVCRHLHVPLQSGSSKVLREMARPYDAEDFSELVDYLRAMVPSVSLTTDVIVGFPGETGEDFEESCGMARRCGFSKIHVFPYSQRKGTQAASRCDQIEPVLRAERARVLRDLSDELRLADRLRRAGTVEWALVEERGHAMTESYHEVVSPSGAAVGSLVRVLL